MGKRLLGVSLGLLSFFNALNVYATEGDAPVGAFNPPKSIELAQVEKQTLTNEELHKVFQKQQKYEKQMDQVGVEISSVVGLCKKNYDEQKIKTYTQLVTCYNQATLDIYQRSDYPYMDLVQSLNDKRLDLGEGIDKSLISEAQAEVEINKFYDGIKEEERKRNEELMKSSLISSSN